MQTQNTLTVKVSRPPAPASSLLQGETEAQRVFDSRFSQSVVEPGENSGS